MRIDALVQESARTLAADWKLDWREESRLVVNVHTAYRELSGESRQPHPLTLLAAMARFERGATHPDQVPRRAQ